METGGPHPVPAPPLPRPGREGQAPGDTQIFSLVTPSDPNASVSQGRAVQAGLASVGGPTAAVPWGGVPSMAMNVWPTSLQSLQPPTGTPPSNLEREAWPWVQAPS